MTSGLRSVTDLAPISLEEVNAVAELQTRTDRKYIITEAQTEQMVAEFSDAVQVLEIEGRRRFSYESMYFDTEDFALYLDTARRRRQRYKVRSRTYVDSGLTKLEVKTKGPRGATVKTFIDYDPADANRLTEAARAFVVDVVGRSDAADGLVPTLATRYERSTFVDPVAGARMTCDFGLTCMASNGATVSLGEVVCETKSDTTPSSFDRWLWSNGVRPLRLSKFCTGLAALHPEIPANKWHRTLQTYFNRSDSPEPGELTSR